MMPIVMMFNLFIRMFRLLLRMETRASISEARMLEQALKANPDNDSAKELFRILEASEGRAR